MLRELDYGRAARYADTIRRARAALNEAVRAARVAGLRVEVIVTKTRKHDRYGDPRIITRVMTEV